MHTFSVRKAIVSFLISALLLFSAATPVLSQAGQAPVGLNWDHVDGNSLNQNYNPQNEINTANAGSLQVSWIFPVPGTPAEWTAAGGLPGLPDIGVGIAATPIVYKGVVYFLTNFEEIFALDAATGKVVWTATLPFGPNATKSLGIPMLLHYHNSAISFTTKLLGGATLWVVGSDFVVYAYDADTGKLRLSFPIIDGNATNHWNIAGNLGTYSGIAPGMVVDEQRGIVITSMAGTSTSNSGRGFFRGWDVTQNPPKLLWTTYTNAPQDGSDPSWDIQQVNNMTGAYIFNGTGAVNLKTLSSSVQNSTLYNDWGFVESPTCKALLGGKSPGGVGSSWGGPWVVDEKTGITYVATNNRNPYDSPCNPGPDLWSASVLAINDQTGKLVWGFQTNPHDSWDWDCSWNQALANETISGQQHEVVIKTCKDGYMYELDAQTGQLYWYFTPPTSDMPRCRYCQILNPLNQTQMQSDYPIPNHATTLIVPGEGGGFENDFAYDPSANIIVAVNHNWPMRVSYQPINQTGYNTANGMNIIGGLATSANSTAYGVDAATGKEIWKYFIPDIGYRGGVTISGGVAYLTLSTGNLVMLNDKTGAVVGQKLIGGPLNNLPAVGATTDGQEELFVPISAGIVTWASSSPPGDMVALALPSSQQISTTSGGTVTVSGQPSTTTGIDPTAFYAVAALAVVFILATGFLAMRRRKPAP